MADKEKKASEEALIDSRKKNIGKEKELSPDASKINTNKLFLRKSLGSLYRDLSPADRNKSDIKQENIYGENGSDNLFSKGDSGKPADDSCIEDGINIELSPEELKSFGIQPPKNKSVQPDGEITDDSYPTLDKNRFPPNIYDILLRIMYHYQAEWLLLTDYGVFLGILTKKYILTKLSEIQTLNDPMIKVLPEKTGEFFSILEILPVLKSQKVFPLIDRLGQVIDKYSRGQFLALAEKAEEEKGEVPLLASGFNFTESPQGAGEKEAVPGKKVIPQNEKREEKRDWETGQGSSAQKIDWFMSLMLESNPFGLAALDKNFRLIFYNEKFKDLIKGKDILKSIDKFEKLIVSAIRRELKKKSTEIENAARDKTHWSCQFHLSAFSAIVTFSLLETNRSNIGYMLCVQSASP